jgi:hypothetical protein
MKKTITFRVELEFESEITQDEDIMQVAENIAEAIKDGTNGKGIAPQNGDTYLEIIRVTPQYLNKTVITHIID